MPSCLYTTMYNKDICMEYYGLTMKLKFEKVSDSLVRSKTTLYSFSYKCLFGIIILSSIDNYHNIRCLINRLPFALELVTLHINL